MASAAAGPKSARRGTRDPQRGRPYNPLMRLLSAVAVLALASCAGTGGAASSPSGQPLALSPDLFPLVPRTQRYAMTRGEPRTLRIESPGAGVATLWLEGGRTPQRMDVTVTDAGLRFRGDPDSETELLRFGAAPGTQWRSGATAVRFVGWE